MAAQLYSGYDGGVLPESFAAAFRESMRLLGSRKFGTFWFASLLSSIGTWAQQVAEPWLLLSLGASSFLIGLDSFAMNAPVWLLTLTGGVLADRADRRRVIASFQSLQMLCPAFIAVLLFTGGIHPWLIVALSVVVGVTDALSMPSFSSIVPTIVAKEHIHRGLALNSIQFNLSRIIGPSIAGVLMSTAGALFCFVISAASYLPFIGVALWILPRTGGRAPLSPPPSTAQPAEVPPSLLGVLRVPHLRGALASVCTTSVLCAPVVTFAPVLVRDAFHGSATQFSVTMASFGVGGILGGVALLGVPARVDRRTLTTAFALLYGVAIVAVAWAPAFALLPLLVAVAGMARVVTTTSANTLLQSGAATHVLGRTVSLYMLAMRGGISIGAVITGATVSLFGVREALCANGLLAIVLQLVLSQTWFRRPRDADAHT